MSQSRHIAVLFHEKSTDRDLTLCMIHPIATYWKEAGHRVTFLRGTKRFVPADLLFVHVDLSLVPDEYLDFAARYPAAVNHRARDIRKSSFSENLVSPGDEWDGPVIAKSDLNYGGRPEFQLNSRGIWQRVGRLLRIGASPARATSPFPGWQAYSIFDRLDLVPRTLADDPRVVIERFVPEIEEDLYHLRVYQFLGDRSRGRRIASRDPLVKSRNSIRSETIEPDPIVEEWRHRLQLDYGKLDYVVHEGKPILLDANKTIGINEQGRKEEQAERRRDLSAGIDALFR